MYELACVLVFVYDQTLSATSRILVKVDVAALAEFDQLSVCL